MNNSFTLSQLAHFDRCLYPGDLFDSLIWHGLAFDYAAGVSSYIKSQTKKGHSVSIINIYQEFIDSTEIIDTIDKVLYDFCNS